MLLAKELCFSLIDLILILANFKVKATIKKMYFCNVMVTKFIIILFNI